MAVAMDALLNIKANVSGDAGVVKLANDVKKLDNGAKEAQKGFAGLTGSVSGLGKMLGAVAPLLSIAGIAALGANAIEAGDHIFDLAQKTGVSVEALAKFGKAAKLGGSDLDEVGKAMVKLSKGLAETAATGTGPAASALQQLGISATDSSGKLLGADKVMLQIADRFKQMPDGAQKTALALQLFGKSGAEIIPVLNQGGKEIDAFSTKMTSAFAAKAATYDDNLKVLQGTVSGLGFAIAEAVLPALTNMTVWMTAVTKAVVTGFTSMKEPIGSALMMISQGVQALTPWVAGIVGVIAVIKLAKAATDAWAMSQKILLAFSGPRGWIMLAAGIGVAALATAGLKKATEGTGDAMKQIRQEIEAAKQQVQGQLAGFELMKDNATQAKDAQAQWKLYVDQTNASYAALQANVASAKQSVDGDLQIANARAAAETAVNNAAKSTLQTKLDSAQTDAERLTLTQQIANIDIENAKLQLQAAEEQIASDVVQARLKIESAKLDKEKAVAELASARARGMATDEYSRAVDAQVLVVNAAIQEYEIAKMVATAKGKAADATYDQAVQQAKANVTALQQRQSAEKTADATKAAANNISAMPSSLERSADAANRLAGGLQDAADASRQVGLLGAGGPSQTGLGNFARPTGLPAFAEGGVVNRPTLAMVGEGGQAEYIIPASKMAAASSNYLAGSRGASVITGGGSKGGAAPQINIQTGPIMQTADGQQWVTIGDLERAQRQTVAAVMGQLRTPAGRYAVGAR